MALMYVMLVPVKHRKLGSALLSYVYMYNNNKYICVPNSAFAKIAQTVSLRRTK